MGLFKSRAEKQRIEEIQYEKAARRQCVICHQRLERTDIEGTAFPSVIILTDSQQTFRCPQCKILYALNKDD